MYGNAEGKVAYADAENVWQGKMARGQVNGIQQVQT